MYERIPLPTDNIYKFYALFSLFLLIFAIGATLYIHASTNALILDNGVEVETLKQEKTPTVAKQTRKAALERKMELAEIDKKFFLSVLGGLIGIAICGLAYGFWKWHTKVQPVIDAHAEVQLEIAKLQLAKLKAEQLRDIAQFQNG